MSEQQQIDKSGWGEGPWQHEPDSLDWTDEETGLACAIRRGPIGHLCGYVRVTPDNLFFGKHYSDYADVPQSLIERPVDLDRIGVINLLCAKGDELESSRLSPCLALDVHGGINYADAHAPRSEPEEGGWWFGFDCGHYGDLSPVIAARYGDFDGVYRDLDYTKGECASLAKQLAALQKETA